MEPTLIRRQAPLVLMLALFFSCFSLQAFQQPLKLSQLYKQLITSDQEVLEISNRKLIDDLNASYELDAYDFLENLRESLGSPITTDSIWVVPKIKNLKLTNVTGNAIALRQLQLDELIIDKGSYRELFITAVNSELIRLDSVTVESEYHLSYSNILTYQEFENHFTNGDAFNTDRLAVKHAPVL